ncbi:uncharacterized protein LOC103721472 isoform X2 [Phoenix dactylifera]|uniref:Uncharacterized protein LOC103721472 isoform X2 n=1 Tax=Phoenix dactylifera TaxID=42345 RepID=A0A8B9A4W3_PHODC|nr:uncharacterized protein LOC103721472 isoform X2 [Phoenix dactylifera]
MAEAVRWGTWEELVLGGAVLRHGAAAWDAVAAEECEAKYGELRERYSGCDAWFEELRKRRVAELKQELEKSEDSIGSLQSKLESLSAERQSDCNFEYDSRRMESPSPTENAGDIDSSSKDISKDGSSAGSFTLETGGNWSSGCQILASVSSQENDLKMELSADSGKDKAGIRNFESGLGIVKKKRGKRKRRDCTIVKEVSMGYSETVSSAACIDREGSSEGFKQDVLPLHEESGACAGGENTNVDLAGIMNSIMEHKDVSIFHCRLESQKRARYKKMIRQHADFQTIISRISNGSISSAKELYRDLLLLSNNALVFYRKDSLEYRSALTLRDLVSESLQKSAEYLSQASGDHGVTRSLVLGKSKKLRSMQPCNRSTKRNSVVSGESAGTPIMENVKKESYVEEPDGTLAQKRSIGPPVKGSQRSGRRRQESSNKGRKRARKR